MVVQGKELWSKLNFVSMVGSSGSFSISSPRWQSDHQSRSIQEGDSSQTLDVIRSRCLTCFSLIRMWTPVISVSRPRGLVSMTLFYDDTLYRPMDLIDSDIKRLLCPSRRCSVTRRKYKYLLEEPCLWLRGIHLSLISHLSHRFQVNVVKILLSRSVFKTTGGEKDCICMCENKYYESNDSWITSELLRNLDSGDWMSILRWN